MKINVKAIVDSFETVYVICFELPLAALARRRNYYHADLLTHSLLSWNPLFMKKWFLFLILSAFLYEFFLFDCVCIQFKLKIEYLSSNKLWSKLSTGSAKFILDFLETIPTFCILNLLNSLLILCISSFIWIIFSGQYY